MALLRILTVDDEEAVRRGARELLSSHSGWQVCGEAEDGIQAVESARALRPDVVVMDVAMPRMNGVDATRAIRQELPETKIILLSQNDPRVLRQQAAAIRAHGIVGKADLFRELVPTIEKALDAEANKERLAPTTGSALISSTSLNCDAGMAALIANKNWAETPLGPVENWSPTLRTITNFLLANRFPLLLWWGPEYIQIYNDAYAPILGVKHPIRALGRPVSECWDEIWHVLKPLIDTPFHGGPATWMEDIELEINRSGKIEETHFTVAYSPVPDETVPSGIGGVLATVHEITEKIVAERRVAILRDLGAEAGEAKTAEQACSVAADVLSKYLRDCPFALLYLNDPDGRHARLVSCSQVVQGEPGAPTVIDLQRDFSADVVWPLSQVNRTLGAVIATGLNDRFHGNVPRGVWSEPPNQAVVVPVRSSQANHLAGFLIVGISAGLRCDETYLSFFDLAARQIATSIANARAYEEERKRAEALAEIDRTKTAFFSNVSHEFRTPLTLMLGPLHDLLARSQTHLSPIAKDQLELVNRNGARLLRLVNTLLDFSRIEAGRAEAVYQATDLAGFTAELASVFRSATDRAELLLLVDCRNLGEPVYIDRDMWEKIVLNLLSNAFKFTFEGEIEVSLNRVDGAAELRVRDTGVGIPAESIPKLFERFHRVANTRSRTHEGSGIGLALVYELVKLHGGSIHAESTVGRGTTFIVRVPFGQNHLTAGKIGGSRSLSATGVGATPFVEEALRWLPDPPAANVELFESGELLPVPCPPSESVARSRILVADDNADMRQYLARLLAEHYEVETVADGQSAINAARQRPPGLILSDVMMPVVDGFELLKEIRANESTRSIPVVLLSARAGEESRVEGLHAGADDYLIKPFSARELLARISARLEIARLQRELTETLEMQVRARTQELEHRTRELMKQSEGIRNLSARLLKVQDEERRRIARDFHDSAGQTLTALGLNLAELIQRADVVAPELAQEGKEIEEMVQQLHREIRTTSYLLHPPLLDEAGLKSSLSWYVHGVAERSGMRIGLDICDDFGRLPADMELAIFRVVQECLTNIHRHSGSKTAKIRVSREEDNVCVEVRDEGKGIPPDRLAEIQSHGSGVGITGMRERLHQFKGDMNIESSGGGTSVLVKIPIPKLAQSTDIEPLEAAV